MNIDLPFRRAILEDYKNNAFLTFLGDQDQF